MKLSIVIVCWNDLKVIRDCLRSIFDTVIKTDFEVIVSDNASTDGSVEFIRREYPQVKLVENGANLGFSKGNNTGIRAASGDYILILNPDTIVHKGALDLWMQLADQHPDAGAFGCRVLNPDGSWQLSARPFATVWRYWLTALGLGPLANVSDVFTSAVYPHWNGDTTREVDWVSGCCALFRGPLLKKLGGFDEQFFYHFEEADLCHRVWLSGSKIVYIPQVTITHLGGQSVKRAPLRFQLESYRSRYRYFYKYFGERGARRCRTVSIANLRIRQLGYGLLRLVRRSSDLDDRLQMYRAVVQWNKLLDPVRFVKERVEPSVG
jgi:GT2 family glycosyltransferase